MFTIRYLNPFHGDPAEWTAGDELHSGYPAYATPTRPLFDMTAEVLSRGPGRACIEIIECINEDFVGLRMDLRYDPTMDGYAYDGDAVPGLVGLVVPSDYIREG